MTVQEISEDQKSDRFDIEKVARNFSESLLGDDDVNMELFVTAYEELNKFIGMLGTIFQFVQADVNSKTSNLRSLLADCPEDYCTVRNMFGFEVASSKHRGTKSLLALHRALQFIVEFMSVLAAATNEASVSEMCRRSYEKTLAKHHNWAIRQAVALASYTLPNRKTLIVSIAEYEPEESRVKEIISTVVKNAGDVYDRVHGYFERHGLQNLRI